jgi:hypothetical protein
MKPTHIEILASNGTTYIVPKKSLRISFGKNSTQALVHYGPQEDYFYISKETYEKVKYELLKEI